MAKIAVLGANSQIAKDLSGLMGHEHHHSFFLFSRRPEEIKTVGHGRTLSLPYTAFAEGNYDSIINFVGSGDPARIARMGGSILDITFAFDDMALAYVQKHPQTRYLFMSSGAAYGASFVRPASAETFAQFSINELCPSDFYSIAKLHAECRHRARPEAAIIDIRIFNYFSRSSDVAARFLVTDIMRAIHRNEVLQVGAAPMTRDFLTPHDLANLIRCALTSAPKNLALDAYSSAPIEKFALIERMKDEFGLRYEIVPSPPVIQATGAKPEYYSTNRRAAELGYAPTYSSIDGILMEARALLDRMKQGA